MITQRKWSLLLLSALLLLPTSTRAETEGNLKWHTNMKAAELEAEKTGKPLMIDLWAQWCAPCKKLAKETFTDPLVVPLLEGFVLAKIDVMEEEHQSLSAEALPKVYFARSDAKEIPEHTLGAFERAKPFAERLKKVRKALGMTVPEVEGIPDAGAEKDESEASKGEKNKKEEPVKVSWILTHSSFAAGQTADIGLSLEVAEGWHVYWKYPSPTELGEPITVTWDADGDLRGGEVAWPAPLEFLDFGEFTTFGYQDAVVLPMSIEVPEDVKPGVAETSATVEWLVCNEGNCIPGSAILPLELKVGNAAVEVEAGKQKLENARAAVAPASVPGISVKPATSVNSVKSGDSFQLAFVLTSDGKLGLPSEDKYKKAVIPFADRAVSIVDKTLTLSPEGNLKVSLGGMVTERATDGATYPVGAVVRFQQDGRDRVMEVKTDLQIGAFASASTPAADVALWKMLLFALIGGLLLNVMPCVLPVLSIKAMGLVNQAGEDDSAIWHHGLAYGLGVILSFMALAGFVVALKISGDLVGWGFQFQNPVFVAVLTALIFGFALSLFGVYEITAPGMDTAHKASAKGGLSGSFFNGAFATLLATPCTAPFLGPAMGFAFSQSPFIIFLMFGAVGAGLALPFVLLARFPAWIKKIPKPGPWMEHFKHGMGFLLIATVVWLLDVLAHMVTPRSLTGIIALLGAISLATWAYGKFAGFTATRKQQFMVSAGALLLIGFSSYHSLQLKELSADGPVMEVAEGWETFSEDRIDALQQDGKTIFIDFTAKWCITCKANEEGVLETDTVRDEMEEMGVVAMVADNTRKDPVINKWLRRFNRSGVPLYVVLSGDTSKEPIVLPEILTENIVMDALKEAGPSR